MSGLGRHAEVAAWSRRTGAQLGFDITSQDMGDISVRLKTQRTRVSTRSWRHSNTRAIGRAQRRCRLSPDLQDNIATSPALQPVQVKIFGEDMPTLINLADRVNRILERLPAWSTTRAAW